MGCQPVGFVRAHEEETVPLVLFVSLVIEYGVPTFSWCPVECLATFPLIAGTLEQGRCPYSPLLPKLYCSRAQRRHQRRTVQSLGQAWSWAQEGVI